ncbi:MAG: hypothetical protein J5I93_02575 [Pirellulaceae bacterium]|nr:hypothetical protein [Pirellulaceae bacterium]
MQRLPPLAQQGTHDGCLAWRLPIPDEVAVVLPACLLVTGQARVRGLTELLRCQAPLTLWVALRAVRRGICPTSCERLAEWFAAAALHELTWDGTGDDVIPGTSPAQQALWARMSTAAAFVAGDVASAAERAGWTASDVSSAYLAGLLHDAPNWLRTSRWDLSSQGKVDEALAEAVESGWLRTLNLASAVSDRHQLADWIAAASVERLSPIAHPAAQPPEEPSAAPTVERLSPIAHPAAQPPLEPSAAPSVERLSPIAHRSPIAHPAAQPPEEYSAIAAVSAGLASHWPEMIESLRRGERSGQEFQQALEREKLAAMKELAYGASHEINNPLANISTRAQTLLRDERDPERRRKLATINAQALRAHEMISDLMLFAHPPSPQIAVVDLAGLVRKVVDECQGDAAAQATELRFAAPVDDLRVAADATLVEAAVHAVCRNALESLVSGGVVEASARCEAENWGRIEIRDNGPGLSDEQRRHAFDPFYSGREAGRGLGLGLSKCWRIAELHGGRIEIASQPGLGTTVSMSFPLATATAGAPGKREELAVRGELR